MKRIYLAAIILCCSIILAQGAVRIKDIARIESDIDRPLIGYGLVVGLEGTGDKGKAGYTTQAVRNMLSRMGLSLSEDQIKVRNVAAVMVTARLNTFAKKGAVIDAMVSSMGDASSLKGGILLQTPLTGPDGKLYALAQGPVSLEGVRTTNGDDRYLTAGRISGGAVLMVTPENAGWLSQDNGQQVIRLILNQPDFTTAGRVAAAINTQYEGAATAVDPSLIQVKCSSATAASVEFVARLENIAIIPDTPAKIVINERTGTIVVGQDIAITPVVISNAGFSLQVGKKRTKNAIVMEGSSVEEVAKMLNSIGVTPRELIDIFMAIRQAGAIQAEIEVM